MFILKNTGFMVSLLVALALTGCVRDYGGGSQISASPNKFVSVGYEGDFKPFEEVAVVTTTKTIKIKTVSNCNNINNMTKKKLPLREFDNRTALAKTIWSNYFPSEYGDSQFHLLPGNYCFKVGFYYRDPYKKMWSTSDIEKILTLKAGEVVHFSFGLADPDSLDAWSVYVSDGSNELKVLKEDFYKLIANKK